MTIRYKCEECESVLKIPAKLAGTAAKCPKCKAAFKVPQLAKDSELKVAAKSSAGPASRSATALEDEEDPIDMPREITPPPDLSSMEDFDPAEALAGATSSTSSMPTTAEAPKPSMADLMREHVASRKNKRGKKADGDKGRKGGLAEAAMAAEAYTSGSAADALTRTYDQKRGKAGEAPVLTREERREEERKEAMKEFAVKGGAAFAALAVFMYFFFSWIMSESLPDLEYVSGVVTLNGAPLPDVEVMYEPVIAPGGSGSPAAGGPSTGLTDANGEYVLMYKQGVAGVIPGDHRITIMGPTGAAYNLPQEHQQKTVPADDETAYNFAL